MKIQKMKEMWAELSGTLTAKTNQTAPPLTEIRTPIPPEELTRFLELSLDAHTNKYLRRLALLAAQSANAAETSQQLALQVERLEQRDRVFTEQTTMLAATVKRLNTHIERAERRDRLARVLQPDALHGQPAEVVQRLQREVAKALDLAVSFRHPLKDGGKGPEMLVIPPGRFLMGSPENELARCEDEAPQHWVTFAKPFAIGCYTVTFADYERFCSKTKRDLPHDNDWGRGWQPVINVSWHDALAYCAWLSER